MLFCVVVFAFWPASARSDEIIDRVLAVVGGDVIMLSDVRAARTLGLTNAGDGADPDRAVLAQLIDRALILNEVERYAPPEPATEAIDRVMQAVRARFPSEAAFRSVLASLGLNETQLRGTLRQDLRIRAYLDQRFVAETPDRSRAVIDGWISGLRSRTEILNLYDTAAR